MVKQVEGDAGASMAKIYHSLYGRMLHEKGLLQAFRKVKSNKRKPGIDGQSIENFAEHLPEEVATLVRDLREKSYRPQPVKRVEIPKTGGDKRLLGIPTVRDRNTNRFPASELLR